LELGGGLDRLGRNQRIGQRVNEYRDGHRFGAAHFGFDDGTGSSGVKLDGTRQQGLNRERTTLDRNDFSIQSVFLEEVQVLCDPKRQQLAAQAGAGNANWCAIRAGKHCRGRQYNHKAEQNSSHVALLELRALSASLSRDRKIVERWISGPALN